MINITMNNSGYLEGGVKMKDRGFYISVLIFSLLLVSSLLHKYYENAYFSPSGKKPPIYFHIIIGFLLISRVRYIREILLLYSGFTILWSIFITIWPNDTYIVYRICILLINLMIFIILLKSKILKL